jgi:hypothetical protein
MADGLIPLLDDESRRRALGQAGLAVAAAALTLADSAAVIVDAYKTLKESSLTP